MTVTRALQEPNINRIACSRVAKIWQINLLCNGTIIASGQHEDFEDAFSLALAELATKDTDSGQPET